MATVFFGSSLVFEGAAAASPPPPQKRNSIGERPAWQKYIASPRSTTTSRRTAVPLCLVRVFFLIAASTCGVIICNAGAPYSGDLQDAKAHVFEAEQNVVEGATATTFIGSAGAGAAHIDGSRLSARLNWPAGMCLLPDGRLFLNDWGGHYLRLMSADATTVSTVAGTGVTGGADGSGSSSQLDSPAAMAYNEVDGKIYLSSGSAIRTVLPSSPYTVTTVAGSVLTSGASAESAIGTAIRFTAVWSIVFSTNFEHLFVADRDNHRVRRITMSSMEIVTVAGDGTASFLDHATATSGQINQPRSLAYTQHGELAVADEGNNRLRLVTLSTMKSLTTLACDGTTSGSLAGPAYSVYCKPMAITAMPSTGNTTVIFFGSELGPIRRLEFGTVFLVTTQSGSINDASYGMVFDSRIVYQSAAYAYRHTLYFSELFNNRVAVATFQRSSLRYFRRARIHRHTTFVGSGTSGSANGFGTGVNSIGGSQAVVALPSGGLLVAQLNCVRHVSVGGYVTTAAGNCAGGGSIDGDSFAVAYRRKSNTVLVTLYNIGYVYSVSLTTGATTVLAGDGTNAYADGVPGRMNGACTALLLPGEDIFLFSENGNCGIRKYDFNNPGAGLTTIMGAPPPSASCPSTDGTGTASRFARPRSMVMLHSGLILIGESDGTKIRQATWPGLVVTRWACTGTSATTLAQSVGQRLNINCGPVYSIAVHPRSTAAFPIVYWGQTDNAARLVACYGTFVHLVAGGSGMVDADGTSALYADPFGIAFVGEENLFVTGANSNRIRRVQMIFSSTTATFSSTLSTRITHTRRITLTPSTTRRPTVSKSRATMSQDASISHPTVTLKPTKSPSLPISHSNSDSVSNTISLHETATIKFNSAFVVAAASFCAAVPNASLFRPLSFAPCCTAPLAAFRPLQDCNETLYRCLVDTVAEANTKVTYSPNVDLYGLFRSNTTQPTCEELSPSLSKWGTCVSDYHFCATGAASSSAVISGSSSCPWRPQFAATLRLAAPALSGVAAYNTTDLFAHCVTSMSARLAAMIVAALDQRCAASDASMTRRALVEKAAFSICSQDSSGMQQQLTTTAKTSSTTALLEDTSTVASSTNTQRSFDDEDTKPWKYHTAQRPRGEQCQRQRCGSAASLRLSVSLCECLPGYTNRSLGVYHPDAMDAAVTTFDACADAPFDLYFCSPPASGSSANVSNVTMTILQVVKSAASLVSRRAARVLSSGSEDNDNDDESSRREVSSVQATSRCNSTGSVPLQFRAPVPSQTASATSTSGSIAFADQAIVEICVSDPMNGAGTVYLLLNESVSRAPSLSVERPHSTCVTPLTKAADRETVCACAAGSVSSVTPVVAMVYVNATESWTPVSSLLVNCDSVTTRPVATTTATAIVAGVAIVAAGPAAASVQMAVAAGDAACPPAKATRSAATRAPGDYVFSPVQLGSDGLSTMFGHYAVVGGVGVLHGLATLILVCRYRSPSAKRPNADGEIQAATADPATSVQKFSSSISCSQSVSPAVTCRAAAASPARNVESSSHTASVFPGQHEAGEPQTDVVDAAGLGPVDAEASRPDDGGAIDSSGGLSAAPEASQPNEAPQEAKKTRVTIRRKRPPPATADGSTATHEAVVTITDVGAADDQAPAPAADHRPAAASASPVNKTSLLVERSSPTKSGNNPPSQAKNSNSGSREKLYLSISGPAGSKSVTQSTLMRNQRKQPLSALRSAAWLTRFPNMYIKLIDFFFFGITLEAVRLIIDGVEGRFADFVGVGCITLVLQFAFASWAQWWAVTRGPSVKATVCHYDVDLAAARRFDAALQETPLPVGSTHNDEEARRRHAWLSASQVLVHVASSPKTSATDILPDGGDPSPPPLKERMIPWLIGATYWRGSQVETRMFGELFASFKAVWFPRAVVGRMAVGAVTAVILKAPVTQASQCHIVFSVLAGVYFFMALTYAFTRLYRRPFDTLLAAIMQSLSGLVALNRTLRFMPKATLMTIVIAIAVVGGVVSISLVFVELAMQRRLDANAKLAEDIEVAAETAANDLGEEGAAPPSSIADAPGHVGLNVFPTSHSQQLTTSYVHQQRELRKHQDELDEILDSAFDIDDDVDGAAAQVAAVLASSPLSRANASSV